MKIRFLQARVSNGCRDLVNILKEEGHNVLRTKVSGSTYRGFSSHLIVNWGRSDRGILSEGVNVLNSFSSVFKASNKIETLNTLASADMANSIPKFTTSKEEAVRLIDEEDEVIYCRTLTRASQGRGIVVARTTDELVDAPLYTTQVPYDREVRVHVFSGKVIDYAQKKKMNSDRRDEESIELSEDIRNLSNGWIFAREGVYIEDSILEVAKDSISALGLDFGAVDMIITPQDVGKVLEVNTAPGLEGTTLQKYKEAIQELL